MVLSLRTRRCRNIQLKKHSPPGLCGMKAEGPVAKRATPALSPRSGPAGGTKAGEETGTDPSHRPQAEGRDPGTQEVPDRHPGPAGQGRSSGQSSLRMLGRAKPAQTGRNGTAQDSGRTETREHVIMTYQVRELGIGPKSELLQVNSGSARAEFPQPISLNCP